MSKESDDWMRDVAQGKFATAKPEPTQETDGLPGALPIGTVYLLKFSAGNTDHKFVSAHSYAVILDRLAAADEHKRRFERDWLAECDLHHKTKAALIVANRRIAELEAKNV